MIYLKYLIVLKCAFHLSALNTVSAITALNTVSALTILKFSIV